MKNSGPSNRQRLDDKKKTSTPASVKETKLSWKEGRRIVELGVLAEQLRSGCEDCKTPVSSRCCRQNKARTGEYFVRAM